MVDLTEKSDYREQTKQAKGTDNNRLDELAL